MSNQYNQLINNLDDLKLSAFRLHLDTYIELVNNVQKTVLEMLKELTDKEMEIKYKNSIHAFVRMANFPFQKTMDDFDFGFQPSIRKEQILDFKHQRFIENRENILFIGSPGVGKTHLATAIGMEVAKSRKLVYFITCNELVLQLKRAHMENNLEKRLKFFCKYKLLIIDEIGFTPLDRESAEILFQLISMRYEKTSTIITTNKALSQWGEVFWDNVLANTILDRLLHHAHVINIVGNSYRTKDIIDEL